MLTRRTMRPCALVTMLLASVVAGCDTSPRGPLAELASEWSGGAPVHCRDTGPAGEPLGPVPGSEYCEWTRSNTPERGGVAGTRLQRRLAALSWGPITGDSAKLFPNMAVLHASLKRLGLTSHSCELQTNISAFVQGTRWESATLVVQMDVVTLPTGGYQMYVVAGDVPSIVGPLRCKPGA